MQEPSRVIAFIPFAPLTTAKPAMAQMGPMHDWGWSWGWPWGGLVGLLFFGLMVVGVVTVVRWLFADGRTTQQPTSRALTILEERYARGEINREEYEQRRRDLAG